MRKTSALFLLAVLVALSSGTVLAQDTLNATNETTSLGATNATTAQPQEVFSKYKQLSNYTDGSAVVLGKNIAQEYSNVKETADRDTVFSREAGVPTPSVKVSITKVNTVNDKYVEVTNQAVGSWDLTGWTLVSVESATYTFQALALDMGESIRVHEGNGNSSKTEIYTNNTAPLWIDNIIALKDAKGNVISSYDVSTAPSETGWVDPLKRLIQY